MRNGMQNGKTILVIEDASALRELLCELLRERGFEVLEAGNGREGLEVCDTSHVDLVCTDVIMPAMDGIEFYQRLQKTAPHLKVIFTSGVSLPSFLEKKIPQNSFVEKTIDLSIVVDQIEKIILGSNLATQPSLIDSYADSTYEIKS
jgi:CheY-like chemotaxis protein